jgi:hypothetical protein
MQICVHVVTVVVVLAYSTLVLNTCKIKKKNSSSKTTTTTIILIHSSPIFQHYNAIIKLENILYTHKKSNIL